jgi:hypothetical protein
MIWSRLKDNRCPKDDCCGKLKTEGLLDLHFICEENCGFKIGEAVYLNITKDRFKPKQPRLRQVRTPEERNLEELNNL